MLRRQPPRLCQLNPVLLYLRIKPVTAGAPAALQELLMALLRAQAARKHLRHFKRTPAGVRRRRLRSASTRTSW
jgi:hypothetical protein